MQAIHEIADSGFLSVSHRSSAFMEVSRQAIEGLKEKMNLPSDCRVFYQPSATAAMDSLLRNLVFRKSFHFVNGAFASLFYNIAADTGLEAQALTSQWDQAIPWQQAAVEEDIELLAFTHNETSTGGMWPLEDLHRLRKKFPTPLIAADVTSSFGSMKMDWQDADVWFGSVQKCLGLPSGLGFLIVNPRAFEKAMEVIKYKNQIPSWQRFDVLEEKMQSYQTPETPNMLNIALLAKQMANWNLKENDRLLKEKAMMLYQSSLPWEPYIQDPLWHSSTVLNFTVDDPDLWHKAASEGGFVLGKGYGPLKEKCIRIGNFPSTSPEHVQRLLDCLSSSIPN